jgi:hypothetical protein
VALTGAAWGSHVLADHASLTTPAIVGSSCDNPKSNVALVLCVAADLKLEQKLMDKKVVLAERYFRKSLVANAQKGFQSYVSSECLVGPSLTFPGTEYPVLVSRCEIKLTAGRIQQIDNDIAHAKQFAEG